ncbi:MAG: histidine phosphatase family protein [Myxococcota bacterium]
MSRIILVRHGQTAGFMTGAYNTLTDNGRAQGAAVGRSWAAAGFRPDRILCGPQPRHQQTLQQAQDAAGGDWPKGEPWDAFDEHAGAGVALLAIPQLADRGHALAQKMVAGETLHGRERAGLFREAMRAWIRGEVAAPGEESFVDFRLRVEAGLRTLAGQLRPDETAAVFTSAGSVAASSGGVLGAQAMAVMELSWSVMNGSITTFRIDRQKQPMLLRFNAVHHLPTSIQTYV